MKSFDALVNAGVKLLDDNGGHPTDAYRAHEVWAGEVQRWLSEQAPNSGLTGEWAAFGSSPLVYGGAYYDEPEAWVSHLGLIRRRLNWLGQKGAEASQATIARTRKRALAKLAALREQIADAVTFDWSDLHYSAELTLEFFSRYAALRDEFRTIDPELFSDLPTRDLPEVPTETGGALIKGQIPSRYLRTLIADMDYILKTVRNADHNVSISVSQPPDIDDTSTKSWDVFISHATEDKKAVAEPLSRALMKAGVSVWYDAFSLKVGQSLMSSIDLGLRKSKFGVVILSQAFFKKDWPQRELHALAQKQSLSRRVILPIWHDVTVEEVRNHFLLLADVVALKWSDGIQTVVEGLLEVITGGALRKTFESGDDQFRELATMSPRQAIKEKWEQLAKAILSTGTRNQVPIQPNDGEATSQIVNALYQNGKLSESDRESFFMLKKWHFSVTFGGSSEPMEPQDAINFGGLADRLTVNFEMINSVK
jgi:hypothetical protein